MCEPKLSDVDRLKHDRTKRKIDRLFEDAWVVLYHQWSEDTQRGGIFCALVSPAATIRIIQRTGWDLLIEEGQPGYSTSSAGVEYHRFGTDEGIEPLVFVRSFAGAKPRSIELAEEFRHFHHLYDDRSSGQLVRIDEAGDDEVVAEIKDDLVRVRKPDLVKFLAAKQMNLVVFFEFDELLRGSINPVPVDDRKEEVSLPDRVWGRWMGHFDNKVLSRLMGKRVMLSGPRPDRDNVWSRVKKYEDYIIGYDEDGASKFHNSNPEILANYFGANPGAPHYLTPVFFARAVLDKYYSDPSKYSVTDGYLQRQGLWGMRLDNDGKDHVVAFLGDLGRDLPHKEQLHWKSHNVSPDGKLSEVAVRRSFFGQFASPSKADHVFKNTYRKFNKAWRGKFGWELFRALSDEDKHLFDRVHIPASESPVEFDSQLIGLTKLMIDSMNDAELSQQLSDPVPDEKSIQKLQRFLKSRGYPYCDRDLAVFRVAQTLRSKSAAHRKGADLNRTMAKLGVSDKSPKEIIEWLLSGLTLAMVDLAAHFVGKDVVASVESGDPSLLRDDGMGGDAG